MLYTIANRTQQQIHSRGGLEALIWDISSGFPLASRLALPGSESVFVLSQGLPMCTVKRPVVGSHHSRLKGPRSLSVHVQLERSPHFERNMWSMGSQRVRQFTEQLSYFLRQYLTRDQSLSLHVSTSSVHGRGTQLFSLGRIHLPASGRHLMSHDN